MFCTNCGNQLNDGIVFCPKCGVKVGSNEVKVMPASSGKRLANYFLDRFLVLVAVFVIIFGLTLILHPKDGSGIGSIISLLGFVIVPIYYILTEYFFQKTPAKYATKTKVVKKDGSRPDFWDILGRNAARIIPFEQFSFLFKDIGWHDSLSGTLVVPDDYTSEQIQLINPNSKGKKSIGLIIVAIIIGAIFFIGLIASVVLVSLNSARAKSRDAKRMADIRQIMTGLELVYNDYDTYPEALNNEMTSKYITPVPVAPTPADGECGNDNEYTYTPLELELNEAGNYYSYRSYNLTFCLGEATANFGPGKHTATPQGIN